MVTGNVVWRNETVHGRALYTYGTRTSLRRDVQAIHCPTSLESSDKGRWDRIKAFADANGIRSGNPGPDRRRNRRSKLSFLSLGKVMIFLFG